MFRFVLSCLALALASDAFAFKWELVVTELGKNAKTTALTDKEHTLSVGKWNCKVGALKNNDALVLQARVFECTPKADERTSFGHMMTCGMQPTAKPHSAETQSYTLADAGRVWMIDLNCE